MATKKYRFSYLIHGQEPLERHPPAGVGRRRHRVDKGEPSLPDARAHAHARPAHVDGGAHQGVGDGGGRGGRAGGGGGVGGRGGIAAWKG